MIADGIGGANLVNAAEILHFRLLYNIMRQPSAYFDTNPIGRILNRFSQDTDEVDIGFPELAMAFIWCFYDVSYLLD